MKNYMLIFFLALWFSACEKDEATKSNDSELKNFALKELPQTFTIGQNNVVSAMVPDGTDLTALTAQFTVHNKAKVYVGNTIQASGFSQNNFSTPLTYRVEAEDGSSTNYTVSIETSPKIRSFSIEEFANTTFELDGLNITGEVKNGTDLSALTATFDISPNSTLKINGVEQVSGQTKNDFTNPITYTISSGTFEENYTVTITETANQLPVAQAGYDKLLLVETGTTTQTVNLDGSESTDPEWPIENYEWTTNGAPLATGETAAVSLPVGVHTITLKVTDKAGASATDEVVIEIRETGTYQPIDTDALAETVNLFRNLAGIANSEQFVFGQEFPLSFTLNELNKDLSTSDCKDVAGDHPGVYGIDPHYMLYKGEDQKQVHIAEAKEAYKNGSIVTIDFHQKSRTDAKIYMRDISTDTDKSLLYDIVNNENGAREWFYTDLDKVLDIINNDLGFPVVFRLFHEMDGDWFWWGSSATNHSTQLYTDFYRLTVDYIKSRTQLVLFAWSPNASLKEEYYPGDAYVDLVGIDMYEPIKNTLKTRLIELSTFAAEHGKVAALTETGQRNNYINNDPDFWTTSILDAIVEGGSEIRIAWVLAWFNAPWSNTQDKLFIPNSNSPAAAQDDFRSFKDNEHTLFQEEVKALNVYQ